MKRLFLRILFSILLLPGTVVSQNYAGANAMGQAIMSGDVAQVKVLLKQGVDPNALILGCTPLGLAIERNDQAIFDLLLSTQTIDIDKTYTLTRMGGATFYYTFNALGGALLNDNETMVKALLERGIDVDYVIVLVEQQGHRKLRYRDTTPLIEAYKRCPQSKAAHDVVQLIANRTTHLNRELVLKYCDDGKNFNRDGNWLHGSLLEELLRCSECGTIYNDVTISLIKRGADVNSSYSYHPDVLKASKQQYLAYGEEGQLAYKFFLLDTSFTPLSLAADAQNAEMVDYLLGHGAQCERRGEKAACFCFKARSAAMFRVLKKYDFDLNVQHPLSGATLFDNIVVPLKEQKKPDLSALEALLKLGANPYAKNSMGRSAVMAIEGFRYAKVRKQAMSLVERYASKYATMP